MHRLQSIAALVLAFFCWSATSTAADAQIVRLVDRAPGASGVSKLIDGTIRRILPGHLPRQFISLEGAPPNPHLHLWIGFGLPDKQQGKVRFEVVMRRKSRAPRTIYEKVLDKTGWVETDVELGGDLEGAQLLFHKLVVEGPPAIYGYAAWGEPLLIPGTPTPATSVILVSIDTLRADQVGIYGNSKVVTPTLDALASSGVWYSNSYSASTWTYPSHAALLYGLYPASLPALESYTAIPPPPLPHNLPQVFRERGYVTAAFTGGGYMSDRWGFTTGFDSFYMFPQPAQTKGCTQDRFDGPVVFDRAEQWLGENAARPFFLFVHTYDVHDRCPVWPAGVGAYDRWPDPGPAGRQKLVDYYDSLVQRADALVAGLLDKLASLGLADRVVVAVTGDHGEGFWEHGFYGHGCAFAPHEELVRVPLIVKPAREVPHRGRIDAPVSAVDVAPTLLALADLEAPTSMQGYVLPGLGVKANERPDSAPIYVQCQEKLAVRVGARKLIAIGKPPRVSEQLYDLQKDPHEAENLIASDADQAAAMRGQADEYWKRGSSEAGNQNQHLDHLDEQTRERLRALGYME